MILKDGEEIFDLECKGLKIIQHPKGYAFTTDAVLLANTVRAYKNERVVELGSGSGVISLLLAKKTPAKSFTGIEVQPRLADMSARSVALNGLEDRIQIVNADMKDAYKTLGNAYDVCCVNPPYSEYNGSVDDATETDICKREVLVTLSQVVYSASKLLKYGGRFYVIVKAERLTDLISAMREYGVEPKTLIPVQPTAQKDVDTIIVEGRRNGKPGIKIKKPLVVCRADGGYTKKVREYYGK